jgi:hypothetical protein
MKLTHMHIIAVPYSMFQQKGIKVYSYP